MLLRFVSSRAFAFSALVVGSVGLTGCSSGGAASASALSCDAANSNALCLQNCSLGCSSTGCQITDIAQNEIITLTFNKDVDPTSVTDASIQFRTATGDVPIGDY